MKQTCITIAVCHYINKISTLTCIKCFRRHIGRRVNCFPQAYTFREHHASANEDSASFTCIRKLNISAYISKALDVKMILTGQSTL